VTITAWPSPPAPSIRQSRVVVHGAGYGRSNGGADGETNAVCGCSLVCFVVFAVLFFQVRAAGSPARGRKSAVLMVDWGAEDAGPDDPPRLLRSISCVRLALSRARAVVVMGSCSRDAAADAAADTGAGATGRPARAAAEHRVPRAGERDVPRAQRDDRRVGALHDTLDDVLRPRCAYLRAQTVT
jgi:hypothetical protein